MRTEIITRVMSQLGSFTEDQRRTVERVLVECLSDYEITSRQTAIVPATPVIPEYAGTFIAKKMLSGRAEGTIKLYKYYLSDFFMNTPVSIEEMDTTMMLRYLYDLQRRKGIGNNTLERVRIMLNVFFEWAQSEGYVKQNFVKNIDPIKYTEKPRHPLSQEDVEILRDACATERERAIFDLLISSGIRISELVGLKWKDIDMRNRTLTVFGKGAKYRTVLFDTKAKISLMKYKMVRKGESESVFVSERAPYDGIKKVAVHNIIKGVAERSGIEANVSAHVLRHTFATHALSKGVSIEKVKELLGHESCDTTLIYAKIEQEQMRHDYRKAFG